MMDFGNQWQWWQQPGQQWVSPQVPYGQPGYGVLAFDPSVVQGGQAANPFLSVLLPVLTKMGGQMQAGQKQDQPQPPPAPMPGPVVGRDKSGLPKMRDMGLLDDWRKALRSWR